MPHASILDGCLRPITADMCEFALPIEFLRSISYTGSTNYNLSS